MKTQKKSLIRGMIGYGQQLCTKKNLMHPFESTYKPAHAGFAYSYGQRNLFDRLNPPSGSGIHRKYAVYGTDCSGLMIELLKNQKINLNTENTFTGNFESTLSKYISGSPDLNSMRLCNFGNISIEKTKPGDFIIWKGHIGLIATKGSEKIVIQSNGVGEPNNEADQAKNIGLNRGVHTINLNTAINGKGFWGKNYQILRLLEIGEKMEGGLLFYLDAEGKRGLVAAETDQSNGARWDLQSSRENLRSAIVANTSLDVFTGKSNTPKITAVIGAGNYAANICDKLVLNGYDDWALPSRTELTYIRSRLHAAKLGDFKNDFYWSSSDANDNNGFSAWAVSFLSNTYFDSPKYGTQGVRAVREFKLQ